MNFPKDILSIIFRMMHFEFTKKLNEELMNKYCELYTLGVIHNVSDDVLCRFVRRDTGMDETGQYRLWREAFEKHGISQISHFYFFED